MYAVIQTGGKQYKVAQGNIHRIEKIPAEVGSSVDFNNVLLVADGDNLKIGAPLVDGGKVTATVEAQGRDKKVKIIKFKRRKHHRKQMGHRQYYTDVKITGIMADGIEPPPEPVEATPPDSEAENVEATPPDSEAENVEATSPDSVAENLKATLSGSVAENLKATPPDSVAENVKATPPDSEAETVTEKKKTETKTDNTEVTQHGT
jgi:large subunit ribosomal protein L21